MDGADWKLTLWIILLSPFLLARKACGLPACASPSPHVGTTDLEYFEFDNGDVDG